MIRAEENLNEIMNGLSQSKGPSLSFIKQLKFKNTLYSSGDSIRLINEQAQQHCFGRIIHIAKTPTIQFPVMLIAWYFHSQDPLLKEQAFSHLSPKELVLSELVDWQYVESVIEKIRVVGEHEYAQMSQCNRKEKGLYFCRSILKTVPWVEVNPMPSRICQCSCFYNPDDLLERCLFCGALFHPRCSGCSDICSACHPLK